MVGAGAEEKVGGFRRERQDGGEDTVMAIGEVPTLTQGTVT